MSDEKVMDDSFEEWYRNKTHDSTDSRKDFAKSAWEEQDKNIGELKKGIADIQERINKMSPDDYEDLIVEAIWMMNQFKDDDDITHSGLSFQRIKRLTAMLVSWSEHFKKAFEDNGYDGWTEDDEKRKEQIQKFKKEIFEVVKKYTDYE